MKLYSIYTDEVRALKNVFLESIKDDWEINVQYRGKSGEGNGDFSSKGWYKILTDKLELIVEKIRENWGEIIIWSDVDIQFFAKCNDLIEIAIADKDIVFQAEWWPRKEVNTGFSVIRCNNKTLALYQLALQSDIGNLKFGDQSAINHILKENKIDIAWDILPKQFWATSHFKLDSSPPPPDIVLHHANCTAPIIEEGKKIGSVELKLQHLEDVRDYVQDLV
jgi:hypothetical protein